MIQAQDNAAPGGPWHIAFSPAISLWIIFWGFFIAVGLIIFLYFIQRRAAPTWVVTVLTLLRIALIVLLTVILLQPSARWVHTQKMPGTLWLLLDSSKSMGFTDQQALPEERLRWACALGFIPESKWPDEFDRDLAQLSILRQLLGEYQITAQNIPLVADVQTRQNQIQSVVDAMGDWRGSLGKLRGRLSGRAGAKMTEDDLDTLDQNAGTVIDQIRRSAGSVDAGGLSFATLLSGVDDAMRDLNDAAESDDQQFLAGHQSDPDVLDGLNRVSAMSRSELALALLTKSSPTAGDNLASAIGQNRVQIVSFAGDATVLPLPHDTQAGPILHGSLSAGGDSTNIASAFAAVAQAESTPEPARVILVSDGRQNVGDDPEPIARLLAAHGINTYTICIGSDRSPPNVQIDAVDAPQWVYKDQTVDAVVLVHMKELTGKPITVDLLRDNKLVAKQTIFSDSDDDTKAVHFSDNPSDVGVYHYDVRLEPVAGITNQAPAQRQFMVAVRRDKLQVLLVEDQPRWEYQYALNYLSRDNRVHLQAVLEHPALIQGVQPPAPVQASANNPLYMAQILPQGNAGWGAYDLIILGDVGPDAISAADQQAIAYAIAQKGAALVLLSGSNSMPQAYDGQPLSDLIPVRLDQAWPPDVLEAQDSQGFTPTLTVEGAASELGRLASDSSENDGLWANMSHWYSHSAYTTARDSADVIWSLGAGAAAGQQAGGEQNLQEDKSQALLADIQVGAGRVAYLASDELWRLRYVNGENVYDNFWDQMIRWASGTDLPAGGKFVRFGTDKDTYTYGDSIHVQARVFGDDLLPLSGLVFQVTATPAAASTAGGAQSASAPMIASSAGPGFYSGTLSGLPPGRYSVSLQGGGVDQRLRQDASAAAQQLTIQINPQPDLESVDPSSDPESMLRIAAAGNGLMMPGAFADQLVPYMTPLERDLDIPEETGFFVNVNSGFTRWLHTIFLAIFVLLITAEWGVRKFAGMI